MVYEAREGVVYDANGFVSGTCSSEGKVASAQRKNSFFRPLTRKLSDAFRKSSARSSARDLTLGSLKANGLSGSCVSIPQEHWTSGSSESKGKLAKSRSLSDITLSFASSKQSGNCRAKKEEPEQAILAPHRAPIVRDAKALGKKRNKELDSKQQCIRMGGSEVSRKSARPQQRSGAFSKLSQELSSKQLLPNKALHIKGFPGRRPTNEAASSDRTSSSVKLPDHGKMPAIARPRAQSYPRKLSINYLDEEATLQAVSCKNKRPLSRSLPNTSSVFFASGVSENELAFVELNRKLDRATLQASASVLSEDGMTMLHKAAQNGFSVLAKFLVNNGVSTEMTDSQGWSPLCVALDNGNFDCAQVLLRLGANVNFVGAEGRTILHKMASEGNYKAVEFLISCEVGLDIEDHHGWPALHYAFRRKKLKCAALLMSSGANIARYTAKRVQEYSMATEIIQISRCRHGLNDRHANVS